MLLSAYFKVTVKILEKEYIVFKPMEDRVKKTWSFQQKAGKGEDG